MSRPPRLIQAGSSQPRRILISCAKLLLMSKTPPLSIQFKWFSRGNLYDYAYGANFPADWIGIGLSGCRVRGLRRSRSEEPPVNGDACGIRNGCAVSDVPRLRDSDRCRCDRTPGRRPPAGDSRLV